MAKPSRIVTFRKRGKALVGTFRVAHLNDFQQADALRRELAAALNECEFDLLVLDVAGLVYFISEIFGVLIQTHRRLRETQRKLAFCNLEREAAELIRVNQLDKFLNIYSTLQAALEAGAAPQTPGQSVPPMA